MHIAVIGSGTVGVMSVCSLLGFTDFKVTCIYNPNKKILGIGESSNVQLPKLLWESIQYNPVFDKDLDATLKYSVLYKNWRKEDFHSPILPIEYAIHFNNFKLGEFVYSECLKKYPDRFQIIKDDVLEIINETDKAKVKSINKTYDFDFVIDCRGWPEDYSDYIESESLLLNKCLVNMIPEKGDWNFTYHYATQNGWMFGIPLQTRQGWGYLFSDQVTSDQEAVEDINHIFKSNLKLDDLKVFKFKPYRAKKFLNGRIMKNGNAAIFYEPLEALSGVMYHNINIAFIDYIYKTRSEEQINQHLHKLSEQYENFICYAYHGGSNFNSKFWNTIQEKTKNHLKNNDLWNQNIKDIKEDQIVFPWAPSQWKKLDKVFGYGYFN